MATLNDDEHKMFREYAWKYFAMHADQRLRTFNFYLTLSAALVGVFAVFAKETDDWRPLALLPLLLSFLTFVFWKFEKRNRQLVRNGEAALKYLDEQKPLPVSHTVPHVLHIHARDDYFWGESGLGHTRDWTYSTCFNAVFLVFGLGGLAMALFCLIA